MPDKDQNVHAYDDIIGLPHHQSDRYPHMTMLNRAAQFSPFAALVGYDAQIRESARLTEQRQELDESFQTELDEKLRWIREHLSARPEVTVEYFQPDDKKDGGAYITVCGQVKKIDEATGTILLDSDLKIPIADIFSLFIA